MLNGAPAGRRTARGSPRQTERASIDTNLPQKSELFWRRPVCDPPKSGRGQLHVHVPEIVNRGQNDENQSHSGQQPDGFLMR
jgi:hypothetical protein